VRRFFLLVHHLSVIVDVNRRQRPWSPTAHVKAIHRLISDHHFRARALSQIN
jgi:hypothetical protein